MWFGDAVYYYSLAVPRQTNTAAQRTVETNCAKLQELAGLTPKTLHKHLDNAAKLPFPFTLVEEPGLWPHAVVLKAKADVPRLYHAATLTYITVTDTTTATSGSQDSCIHILGLTVTISQGLFLAGESA